MNLIPQYLIDRKEIYLKKVKRVESGCWEWAGYINGQGYGQVSFENKRTPDRPKRSHTKIRAHRLFYAIYKGDPHGLFVCHKCDNRKCVNPDHLFLGTDKDNMHDMIAKGRARPNVTGLESPLAKMDQETLDRMAKDYWDTPEMTTRELAKLYNISSARCYYWLNYNNTPMKHKWHTRKLRMFSNS